MEQKNRLSTINDTLTLMKMQINEMQKIIKLVEKDVIREVKKDMKQQLKDSKKKRVLSGFAKPCKVSDKLCEFLSIPLGSEVARTEVTKMLNNYIKEHDLKNNNRIVPDNKLKNLLELSDESELENLSYFNIQKYMNKHFQHKSMVTILPDSST